MTTNISAYFGETLKSGSGVVATADFSGATSVAANFGPLGVGGFASAQFQFVTIGPYSGTGSSSASLAGATLVSVAGVGGVKVLGNKPQQGDPCQLFDTGEVKVVAGAALAVGQIVMSDANGRAVPWIDTGSNAPVGECRVPANAANDICTIWMEPAFISAAVARYQYTTTSAAAIPNSSFYGARDTVVASSGSTATTTPTAAQIIAGVPGWTVGDSYVLRILNTNVGTLTLTAGTGVTLTGTATIATAVWREYLVTYTAAGAVTMQNIGAGAAT